MSDFDLSQAVTALLGVLAAVPTAYLAAKKRVRHELYKRLEKVSGGEVATIEDLVANALVDKRLREKTPLDVYGDGSLWAEVRKGRFYGARRVLPEDDQGQAGAEVAVVDAARTPEDVVANLPQRYVLIYKEGPHYQGELPPGAEVTFANSGITLDARLMETLHHMEARS